MARRRFNVDSCWRLQSSLPLLTVIPGERSPVEIDTAVYDSYVGRYALAPGVVYNVTQTGGKLFMQRGDEEKRELFPLDETRFFRDKGRGEIIFAMGSKNVAGELILRRDNNDIVWKRVPD